MLYVGASGHTILHFTLNPVTDCETINGVGKINLISGGVV